MVPKIIIFFKPILPRKTGWSLFLPGTETDKKVPVFLTLETVEGCQKFKDKLGRKRPCLERTKTSIWHENVAQNIWDP